MAPPRGPRQPACEPCRVSKLSCDHTNPPCGRCLASNKADICIYRQRPSKRNAARRDNRNANIVQAADDSSIPGSTSTSIPVAGINYPNPGYMGASSHAAIFYHIAENNTDLENRSARPNLSASSSVWAPANVEFETNMEAVKAAECMKPLFTSFTPDLLNQLLAFWRATRANLTLGEPLIDTCRRALDDIPGLTSASVHGPDPYLTYARDLLRNSARPLLIHPQFDLKDFCQQFLDSNTRLETIGLLICAIIRAASEVRMFPPLYVEDSRRRSLISLAAKLANIIVEATLSIDMLNDLQLILQYENFISHSFVFGVQCL